jgi:transmembrane sensor
MEQERIWSLIAKNLTGEASAEELRDLETLLRMDPELHYPIQAIMDSWTPDPSLSAMEASQAFDRHSARMRKLFPGFAGDSKEGPGSIGKSIRTRKREWTRRMSVALVLVIPIFLTLGWLWSTHTINLGPPQNSKANSEISTRNGSKSKIVLSDGTQVWLNAGSRLSYDKNFNSTLREVTLSGEAFFDVAHNAEKPFLIRTTSMDIKVLGTRFNVKSYPTDQNAEADLLRGSIEVSLKDRPDHKITLKPNEKIVVSNRPPVQVPEQEIVRKGQAIRPAFSIQQVTYFPQSKEIVETSWVENKLIFQDETFEDLSRQLDRWFAVTIRFENPEKKELRFTGSFANESIQQALEALQVSGRFQYQIHEDQVTIK